MSLFPRRRPAEAPALPFDPRSPEGLAARWVQWVAAGGINDPIEDRTGEFAAANQPDDVWFLAGSYGKTLTRSCFVPEGRDLFLPLFNLWQTRPGPTDGPPVVPGAYGSLAVDGVPVEGREIGTPVPFLVSGRALNVITARTKPVPVTVWGLWGLVPALPAGPHEVRLVGGYGDEFTVDVTYRLVVSAPHQVPPSYATW
jgi:hypothetical protein